MSGETLLDKALIACRYSQFMVGMGDTDRYYTSSDYKYAFTYKSIVHDDYQEDRLLNDIAFLQLLYPISFTGWNAHTGIITIL